MRFGQALPEAARRVLAQFDRQIEYSRDESEGRADFRRSAISNDDLNDFVFSPGIDALILDDTVISDAGLKSVVRMRILETLLLNDTLVSDEGLIDLLALPYLERLEIGCSASCFRRGLRPVPSELVRRNQITDRGLGFLVDVRCLLHLALDATRVTDAGLRRHILEMPQLQELSVALTQITDDSLETLQELDRLQTLNLTHTSVSSRSIVKFVVGTKGTLRRLNLSNTAVDDEALADVARSTSIKELTLIDTGITNAGCREIAQFGSLTDLRLDYTIVGDGGVHHLGSATRLQRLELFNTKVTDFGLSGLANLNLKHLGLGCTSITDAGMTELGKIRALQSLDLQSTAVTDTGLQMLSSASHVKRLYLENTRITNAGLKWLLKMPLAALSLNPKLDDAGLRTLALHKSLRMLAVWGSAVTSWQPVSRLDRLEVLLIDDCVADLAPLRALRSLRVLLLWGSRFPAIEVAKLRLALPECQIKTFEPHEPAVCEFRLCCCSNSWSGTA